MTMGSLIEMYLTAYGWQIYGLIYLAFWMTKIILYPMIRLAFDIYIDGIRSYGAFTSPLRDVITKVASIVLVFTLGVIPMVPFNVTASAITSPGCGSVNIPSENMTELQNKFGGNIYVPILPYFVMSLSSGVNAIILNQIPCADDILEANKIANSFVLSDYGDAGGLRAELQDFGRQCYKRAKDKTLEWNSSSDPKVQEVFGALRDKYFSEGWFVWSSTLERNTNFAGGKYFEKVFYTDEAKNSWSSPYPGTSNTWKEMSLSLPLTILTTKVSGVHSNCQLNDEQTATNIGCVACGDYWNGKGSQNGLIHRLTKNYLGGIMKDTAGNALNNNKSPKIPIVGGKIDPERMATNPDGYIDELFNKLSEKEVKALALKSFEMSEAENAEHILSGTQTFWTGALFAVNTFTSKGANLGQIANTATTLMLVKAAIKLIYPMLLMMVYALWIVYLVVAEFKGIAFIKGLLMIFVLKLCTSVWAIADIVGSEMMTLLYPKNEGTLDWILSMPDASIVLVATTLFYFIVPSLMLYLVV